ncbi:MAG: type IV toxin-antitoxin system AbiEi family antitoxin domain-containing protein [Dehalococcoidia bacterium]|nr:type IV toxin-antitoxin system AbiEi family antitoxin domain-containing protein [Dehalococcoidia bacterium]
MTSRGNQSRQYGFDKAIDVFRQHGGILRTKSAVRAGVHPRTLYDMRDTGALEQLSRGLFRLAGLPPLTSPDLVSATIKVPNGVICLISALAFHQLTTEIPHEVYVAIERGSELPRLEYPPLRVFWFSGSAFTEGIVAPLVDGIPVRVYSREKTLADCFKYRNKIGLDTAIEALKLYCQRGNTNVDALIRFSRICRVERIIKPYVEALL